MLKYVLMLIIFSVLISGCCELYIQQVDSYEHSKTEYSESIEKEKPRVFEHRLIVGYESRDAVEKIMEMLDARILKELSEINAVSLEIEPTIGEALKKLKSLNVTGIRYIEPSYMRYLFGAASEISDPYYKYQWALAKVGVEEAWKEATGKGIVIAVIDTPIDGKHPDLTGKLITGYDPGDATHEATIILPDTDYEDPMNPYDDHGTHVAGIIAASKNNGEGIVGLAYDAKVMPIVAFRGTNDHNNYYYVGDEYVADAIIWAVDHGADIISNSWGGPGYSQLLKDAIDYALRKGVIVIAAAGNEHTQQHHFYPAAYPGVIAVGASDVNDEVADFSSRGDYLSVVAPGVGIISCIPRGSAPLDGIYDTPYSYWSGTSMAAPYVSAMAALIKEIHPNITPYQVKRLLEKGSKDLGYRGYDTDSGYGRISSTSLNKTPDDYPAKLVVKVLDHTNSLAVPGVSVCLTRPDGANYYAKTNKNGEAIFLEIDPDTYEVYVGGPDWTDVNTPNLRMEEELTAATIVELKENTTVTLPLNFSSTFYADLKANVKGNYTVKLVKADDGTVVNSTSTSSSPPQVTDFGYPSGLPDTVPGGKFYLIVERDATGVAVRLRGAVYVNGCHISVEGYMSTDTTSTDIDEDSSETYWWTLF